MASFAQLFASARIARLCLAGLALAFFGLLTLAAALFPRHYDWRYQVISNLSSPRDNPAFYPVASAGLAFSGLFLWPLADFLRALAKLVAPRISAWACHLHRIGCGWLILTALISGKDNWLGWPRLHEDCAELAGLFFGLAFVGWTWALVKKSQGRPGLQVSWVLLMTLPLGGLLLSRMVLFIAWRIESRASYEVFRHSIWGSLAIWEWCGAVCLYAFLVLAVSRFARR